MNTHRAQLNRRDVLCHLTAGTLLSLGLWPGALRAADRGSSAKFRFVVLNDTHYDTPECGQWLEGVLRRIKSEQPEFCLVAGDLTDKGTSAACNGVRDALKSTGLPIHVQIGNHDYLTDTDRSAYEQAFPRQINSFFRHDDWQFIGLDSSDGQRYQDTRIQETTLRWVDERRPAWDRRAPTVIFTHFPMGAGVTYRPRNADALLERFREFNLQAVFCGHYHGFTERTAGVTALTTNRCCARIRGNHDGTKEKGYFVCDAADGRVLRKFVEYKAT